MLKATPFTGPQHAVRRGELLRPLFGGTNDAYKQGIYPKGTPIPGIAPRP